MTSSYLFLNQPGGASATQDETRAIRDGFSLVAYLFPWLWLASHRLWLHALAALLLQIAGGALMEMPGLSLAGGLLILATGIIVGLEGENFRIQDLLRKGWTEAGLVRAESLDAAEEIYFSTMPVVTKSADAPVTEWGRKPASSAGHGSATSLGLFGFGEGR